MGNATIYSNFQDAEPLSRERLIYANAEMALARVVNVERHFVAAENGALHRSPLGLTNIIPPDPAIAIGILPHIALADFQKCSLLAADLGLDDATHRFQDIEQLIWSCANTSRAVAVGDDAWRSMQMLPLADRRHYLVPPLKLPPAHAATKIQALFIINHEADDRHARELAELAGREGFEVACSGLPENFEKPRGSAAAAFGCSDAAIHIHVGHHNPSATAFRLIDSWHSGRLSMQYFPSASPGDLGDGNLMIEDEVNGLICHSAEAVLAACKEVQQDHVLGRKLISAGHRSAEPLARAWLTIAQDLLA